MGKLYELIQAHMDAQPYEVRPADVARALGVSRQTVLNWREPSSLIGFKNLTAIANLTGVPYIRVLDANLEDIGYIPRSPDKVTLAGEDDPKQGHVKGA